MRGAKVFALASGIGLAAVASDVYTKATQKASTPEGNGTGLGIDLVDLNEAPKEEFVMLDGLAPELADRIISLRPFSDAQDVHSRLKLHRLKPLRVAA